MKKNSGITLLALIITIIIMLILAGVTISIVGGSDGIIAKAEQAVSKTDKAAMGEDAELSVAAIKMDYYENYAANRAKYANAKAFIVDKLQTAYTTSRGATMVADSEGNVTYTYKGVVTALTLGEDGSVTLGESSNGGTVTPDVPVVPEIPEGLTVGDTVSYNPSGTYTWQSKYYASTVDSYADVDLAAGNKVSSGKQDMTVSSWKVFSIDENTGKVEIVPATSTETVTLEGAQGYNNGVKLLNDACSNLYSDTSKGITARSINMEDIESIMYYENGEKIDFIEYYKTKSPPESDLDENYQYKNALLSPYSNYPLIYEQEELSTITYAGDTNETKIAKGEGLKRSEQKKFIESTEIGIVSGEKGNAGQISTAISTRPYGTWFWMSFISNIMAVEYKDIVVLEGSNANYWVASRSVSGFGFGIRYINDNNYYSGFLLARDGGYNKTSKTLFPVVSFKANLLTGNDDSGWSVE